MPVRLTGSTSGYTELDAPAVAGNNTIKMPTSNGSAYQIVRNGATAGTLEYTDNIVSGTAQASTSGTSIDFTGIPSWVKRVTVMFSGVSTNGSSIIQVQIGDSGGIENTGYTASSSSFGASTFASTSFTTGFGIRTSNTAGDTYQGSVQILNLSGNVWIANGTMFEVSGFFVAPFGGTKTLSGTLDRIRVTTVNGTDTFDAGTINILYE